MNLKPTSAIQMAAWSDTCRVQHQSSVDKQLYYLTKLVEYLAMEVCFIKEQNNK